MFGPLIAYLPTPRTRDGEVAVVVLRRYVERAVAAGVGGVAVLGSAGGFGAVLLLANNWADWEATRRSYELMARYVHPHFQRHSNALRVASYDNATAKHETAGEESKRAVESEIERYEQVQGKAAAGGKAW